MRLKLDLREIEKGNEIESKEKSREENRIVKWANTFSKAMANLI